MSAIRPLVFGLAMAAVAAFGTDYILQKRAQADLQPQPPETSPTPPETPAPAMVGAAQGAGATPAAPPAVSEPPQPRLDLKVGERAMSLPLKEGALDSFLRPGSLIDVLATIDFQGEGGKRQTATTVVAEGARVLAVHDQVKSRSTRRPSITVAVGYRAAGAIELAATKGSIAVVARSQREPTGTRASQVSLQDLVIDPTRKTSVEAPVEAGQAATSRPEWSVRVIRGTLTTEEGPGKK